ncbi:MAG: hypothetical protein JRI99_14810, partial [Deltaproteobacteria bacterium]|nr:hypothetical protein [Deltaproteobacteria bacterium]
ISPKLFAGLKSSAELELENLTGRELFTLFELGIVDTEDIIWKDLNPDKPATGS